MRPYFAVGFGLGLALLLAGCGSDNPLGRKGLSGNVTLDGGPLAKGEIEFHPQDGGVQSGGAINGGRYSIAAHDGATPGKYKVVIYDTYDTPPQPKGYMPGDDLPNPPPPKIGPEWNSKSDHVVEIKKEGPFKFNFDVKSKKK